MTQPANIRVFFINLQAMRFHLNWRQDGLMPSRARHFVENADNRSLVGVGKRTNGCNWDIACLMIVDARDVCLSTISGFTNEDTVRTSHKSVGASVDKGIL